MLGTDSVNDTIQAPTDGLSSTRTDVSRQHNHITQKHGKPGPHQIDDMTSACIQAHVPNSHHHLLFILADNEMISLQDLEGLLPFLLAGAKNCHLQRGLVISGEVM